MDEREQKQIFDRWLNEHKGIIFKVVRANAFTPHDQDDLFQEICLQMWQSVPNFDGRSKTSTWIYRVAFYTASTWVRSEKRRPATEPLTNVERALLRQAQTVDPRLDWLYEQIGPLEPIDRSLCLLLLDGFSYREMAELLGISESNVGVKIHRIKRQLVRKSKEVDHYGV